MNDLHLVAMVELHQGSFETTLADVTPRTNDVRPDINAHSLFSRQGDGQCARGLLIHCHAASRFQREHLDPTHCPVVRVVEAVRRTSFEEVRLPWAEVHSWLTLDE